MKLYGCPGSRENNYRSSFLYFYKEDVFKHLIPRVGRFEYESIVDNLGNVSVIIAGKIIYWLGFELDIRKAISKPINKSTIEGIQGVYTSERNSEV